MNFESGLKCLFTLWLCIVKNIEADPLINQIESERNKNADRKCGGVLLATENLEVLSYNMEKPKTQRYESCIWTIHAQNQTSIRINVTDPLYTDDNEEFLKVGYFTSLNYNDGKYLLWKTFSKSYTPQFFEFPAPVVFIHYSSTYPEPRFGFRIIFQASGNLEDYDVNFDHYFLEGESGYFRYQLKGDKNEINQRTTIVLKATPGPALGNFSDHSQFHILTANEQSQNKEEYVTLYGYGEGSKLWYRNSSLYSSYNGRLSGTFYNPRNDPVIITFMSNGSAVGNGFRVLWMNKYFNR